jgi:hypothetical protein
MEFFKFINSVQLVGVFAGFPYGLSWLWNNADFPGATIASWVAGIVYFILFCVMIGITFTGISLDKRLFIHRTLPKRTLRWGVCRG